MKFTREERQLLPLLCKILRLDDAPEPFAPPPVVRPPVDAPPPKLGTCEIRFKVNPPSSGYDDALLKHVAQPQITSIPERVSFRAAPRHAAQPETVNLKQYPLELLFELLHEVLPTLSDREQKILLLRFDTSTRAAWTLEAIGERYHITRERVRQIEKRALHKLRAALIKKLTLRD